MAEPKAKPPPPTEILSTTRRPATAEELTSPQEEFVATPPVEPPAETPPEETPPQEPTEQPFEIDETPPEPPPEELSDEEKRVQDAQREMHDAKQEIAAQRKMIDALVRQQQLASIAPPSVTGPAEPPASFFDSKPSAEELADPNFFEVYTKRQLDAREFVRERQDTERELQNFMRDNPKWNEVFPIMEEIKNEDPYAYQKPGSLRSLHARAVERQEYRNMQTKLREIEARALQTGANIQQTKANRPFATPRAAGGAGIPQQRGKVPADFASWDTDKQLQWMKDNKMYKEDYF